MNYIVKLHQSSLGQGFHRGKSISVCDIRNPASRGKIHGNAKRTGESAVEKREKQKQNNMKINENEIWNAWLTTKIFNPEKELESTTKHNVFRHTLTWYDAKTCTVRQAIDFTDLDNYDDRKELMLLIKHKLEDGESVLQFATGVYLEVEDVPEPILEFRFCFITKEYKYLPIEGKLLAFAFVDDLPLMIKFNEIE